MHIRVHMMPSYEHFMYVYIDCVAIMSEYLVVSGCNFLNNGHMNQIERT